jgi:hypothetical protein
VAHGVATSNNSITGRSRSRDAESEPVVMFTKTSTICGAMMAGLRCEQSGLHWGYLLKAIASPKNRESLNLLIL